MKTDQKKPKIRFRIYLWFLWSSVARLPFYLTEPAWRIILRINSSNAISVDVRVQPRLYPVAVRLHLGLELVEELAVLLQVPLRDRHLPRVAGLHVPHLHVAEQVRRLLLELVENLHDVGLVLAVAEQVEAAVEPVRVVQVADDDHEAAPLVAVDEPRRDPFEVRLLALGVEVFEET